MTDQTILSALRAEDDAGLREVYLKYRIPCQRFLLGRVISRQQGNREELAVELFTESLIILVENVRSGRLSELSARLDTYLNAVSHNLYRKLLRRNRVEYRDPEQLPPPLVEVSDPPDPEAVRQELYGQLKKLGERCRQLLVHFYFLELDWETTAEVLGYKNADSAKNNKAKCMKRLRTLYGVLNANNKP